ncbi:hypothetical protein BSL78_25125 [Apostichopus japonicus]|uniref:Uncharacterized protein n=1 Tax=Stichopus japonicus TaxID=307972 RepID=A0A2G8JQI4_STIJA|nr:hypothetical protein BSL78_25125 [Apostichopus japonicus]
MTIWSFILDLRSNEQFSRRFEEAFNKSGPPREDLHQPVCWRFPEDITNSYREIQTKSWTAQLHSSCGSWVSLHENRAPVSKISPAHRASSSKLVGKRIEIEIATIHILRDDLFNGQFGDTVRQKLDRCYSLAKSGFSHPEPCSADKQHRPYRRPDLLKPARGRAQRPSYGRGVVTAVTSLRATGEADRQDGSHAMTDRDTDRQTNMEGRHLAPSALGILTLHGYSVSGVRGEDIASPRHYPLAFRPRREGRGRRSSVITPKRRIPLRLSLRLARHGKVSSKRSFQPGLQDRAPRETRLGYELGEIASHRRPGDSVSGRDPRLSQRLVKTVYRAGLQLPAYDKTPPQQA